MKKEPLAPNHGGLERRRTRRKRRSLRTRLIIAFVSQLLIVVGAIGYLTFTESEESVSDVADQLREELSERVSQKVNSYVEIPQQLNNTNADAFARGILSFDRYRDAARLFWKQMKAYDTVAYISVGTKDGLFFGIKRMLHTFVTEKTRIRKSQRTSLLIQMIHGFYIQPMDIVNYYP